MITNLLLFGLIIVQGNYSYNSDVVQYQQGKNYIICEEDNSRHCSETFNKNVSVKIQKKKDISSRNKVLPEVKTSNNHRITIPMENIMATINNDPLVVRNNNVDKNKSTTSEFLGANKSKTIKASEKIDTNQEFVIETTGYYVPEDEENLLADLSAEEAEEKEFAIKSIGYYARDDEETHLTDLSAHEDEEVVLDAMEINFFLDNEGLVLASSDLTILEHLSHNYQKNPLRITSYAKDDKEAFLLVNLILDKIKRNVIFKNIELVENKSKRFVLIEVIKNAIQ